MKKYLLILAVAALPFGINTAKAQIVSASEDAMETWTTDLGNPSAKDPNTGPGAKGWQCLNPMSSSFFGGSPISTFEENTIVHGGSHSCKLTSVVLTSGSYNYVKAFIPHDTCGFVMSGTITSTPSFKLGVPFTSRITSLSFWYQYMPAMNGPTPDTASCSVVLTHHFVTTNQLGAGYMTMNGTGSTWTHGTVNIAYDSLSGNPDTVIIIFSSSSFFAPVPGSIFYLDDITTPAGINEVNAANTHVDVFPNPASTEVNFSITGEAAHSIEIYDITGKKVNTYSVKDNLANVNTSSYATGLYFYQLRDKDGNMMKVGKFTVER